MDAAMDADALMRMAEVWWVRAGGGGDPIRPMHLDSMERLGTIARAGLPGEGSASDWTLF